MTDEAAPDERSGARSDLEQLRDQVTDLAMLDVIIGAGLMVGGLAAAAFGLFTSIPYAARTASWSVFWSGEACLLLATVGFLWRGWRGWSATSRRLVVGLGAAGFASFTLQVGSLADRKPVAPLVCLCAGPPLLVAGIGLWRGRRWGRSLQAAIIAAASAGFGYLTFLAAGAPVLAFFPAVTALGLPALLLPFLDPLIGSLFPLGQPTDAARAAPSESAAGRFARWRPFARAGFAVVLHGVVLVGVFLSLIVPPNVWNAVQRSKQKRTLADIHSLATALEEYSVDHGNYPVTQDVAALGNVLAPKYITRPPRDDAWGWPFDYHRVRLGTGAEGFVIRSAGADGVFEQTDPTAYPGRPIGSPERDLVYSTVSPSQWPEGQMPP